METDSKWINTTIPLMFYLADNPELVHVSDDGHDTSACGFEEFKCKSVDYAINRFLEKKRNIAFGSTYQFLECIALNASEGYHFCGLTTKSKIEMMGNESDCSFLIDITSNAIFELMTFILPSSLSLAQTCIFVISDNKDYLDIVDSSAECFPSSSGCNYSFVCSEGGRLSIISFRVESIKFNLANFLLLSGNGLTSVNNMTINFVQSSDEKGIIKYTSQNSFSVVNLTARNSNSQNCGLIYDLNGKLLSIKNSSFNTIKCLEDNGSTLNGVIGDGNEIVICDTIIENCVAAKGYGGGINVVVQGTGKLRLGSNYGATYFGKCAAMAEDTLGGYGGAVLLGCIDEGKDFVMTNLSFGLGESGNSATFGGKKHNH
ncbi:uncharacterized protein MONOS_17441 [Monocercomonoides exilis]|uniref:uncharacterized protein n=1 Tax=Monocercomonoides exilis TaxID=2049356 RepID=UPI00355A7D2F|nr:hypothetical protein MONOS_17441 [Monocercomonoides exilis]